MLLKAWHAWERAQRVLAQQGPGTRHTNYVANYLACLTSLCTPCAPNRPRFFL